MITEILKDNVMEIPTISARKTYEKTAVEKSRSKMLVKTILQELLLDLVSRAVAYHSLDTLPGKVAARVRSNKIWSEMEDDEEVQKVIMSRIREKMDIKQEKRLIKAQSLTKRTREMMQEKKKTT